jgi:hypothetical protein
VKYFALLYRLNAADGYLIWISNDKDSVVVDNGRVVTFDSATSLRRYADLNHLSLESEDPILHDLDWVRLWTNSPSDPVDCRTALAAWNLFGDVAVSVGPGGFGFCRLDSKEGTIYQKLFWGNNLPSLTPEGYEFIPEWSSGEVERLTEILRTGLSMFEAVLQSGPSQ